jgi:protein involved in polysaccharide export with SLBB domain
MLKSPAFSSVLAVALTLVVTSAGWSQAERVARVQATRAELQQLLQTRGDSLGEEGRAAVQRRLSEGDFQVGDRIVIRVIDEPTLTDTFAVRSGRSLSLPNLPDLSLTGVLRSEVDSFLTQKISQHIRNPQVDAIALIRVAVLGAVNRPGFYNVPAEFPVSDVVMAAGGPSGNADLKKATVRRGTEIIVTRKQMENALASGTSVDQLNLVGGDQLLVGERSGGIKGALSTLGVLSGVIFAIAAVAGAFN